MQIADRIDGGLRRELGEGIERDRMVREPLYARDVLLVCDALPATDLAKLSRHFRAAIAAAESRRAADAARATSGFSASRFFSSWFGNSTGPDKLGEAEAPAPRRGPWFSGRTRDPGK